MLYTYRTVWRPVYGIRQDHADKVAMGEVSLQTEFPHQRSTVLKQKTSHFTSLICSIAACSFNYHGVYRRYSFSHCSGRGIFVWPDKWTPWRSRQHVFPKLRCGPITHKCQSYDDYNLNNWTEISWPLLVDFTSRVVMCVFLSLSRSGDIGVGLYVHCDSGVNTSDYLFRECRRR